MDETEAECCQRDGRRRVGRPSGFSSPISSLGDSEKTRPGVGEKTSSPNSVPPRPSNDIEFRIPPQYRSRSAKKYSVRCLRGRGAQKQKPRNERDGDMKHLREGGSALSEKNLISSNRPCGSPTITYPRVRNCCRFVIPSPPGKCGKGVVRRRGPLVYGALLGVERRLINPFCRSSGLLQPNCQITPLLFQPCSPTPLRCQYLTNARSYGSSARRIHVCARKDIHAPSSKACLDFFHTLFAGCLIPFVPKNAVHS